MAERALPTLDLSGFSSQVANNWKKWKRAFEYYAEAEAYHLEAFNPGSMLPIIPNQSNLTS